MPTKGTGLITITDLNESYSALLSSEAVSITTDTNGQNPSMNGASTTVLLMLGNSVVTAYIPTAATLNASYVSGCKVLVSGTTVSFDGSVDSGTGLSKLTSDTGYVDIPIYSNAAMTSQYLVATKRFSFAKSKTGAKGDTGAAGGAGSPGSSYVLNITGGTRSVTYAADNTTPVPSTGGSFTYVLYKSGVSVASGSITSVTWSASGVLGGSSTSKTAAFQPTVQAQYNSGTMANSSVSVTVVCDGNTIVQTVPIAVQRDAAGLDWVNDWNGQKTVIGGTGIVTPKMFAGENKGTSGDPELIGIAMGRDVLSGSSKKGIYGYSTVNGIKNTAVFGINPDPATNGGNMLVFGVEAGNQFIVKNDGKIITPKISADLIEGGTLQLGGASPEGDKGAGAGYVYNEHKQLVTSFDEEGTRINYYKNIDEYILPEAEVPLLVSDGATGVPLLTFNPEGNLVFGAGLVSRNVDLKDPNNNEIIMNKRFLSFHKNTFNYMSMQTPSVDHYADFAVLDDKPGMRLTSSTGMKMQTRTVGHILYKGAANSQDLIVLPDRLPPHSRVNLILQIGFPLLVKGPDGKPVIDEKGRPMPIPDANGNIQFDTSLPTYVQGTDYKLTIAAASGASYTKYYVDWSLAGQEPAPGTPYMIAYSFSTPSNLEGVNTVLGYMDMGVKDTTAAYLETDRSMFKVNKKIEVTGAVEIKGTNQLSFVDYGGGFSMSDTTWIRTINGKSFYQDTGTMRTDGTFHVGSSGGTLSVANGGNFAYRTNVLFANTGGNVGIGTASPTKKLHVAGDAYVVPTGVGITIDRVGGQSSIKAGTANSGYLMLDSSGAGTGALGLNWYTSDNVILVNGGGKVGIGTVSPLRTLDVGGELRVSSSLIYGGSSYLGFVTDAGGALPVKMGSLAITSSYSNSAPANGMYVQGSVGIGTTSPSYPLHVVGDIYNTGWVRTAGNTGIYFDSYGGGWHMTDTTWVRAYNGKSIHTAGLLQADGGVTVTSGKRVIDSNGNLETLDTVRYGTAASTKYNSTTKSIDFIFN